MANGGGGEGAKKKEVTVSAATRDRAEAAKSYIESVDCVL